MPWCSVNHICLTRRRSPIRPGWHHFFASVMENQNAIQAAPSTFFDVPLTCCMTTVNLKSFSSMPWCSSFHICLTRRRSSIRPGWHQFFVSVMENQNAIQAAPITYFEHPLTCCMTTLNLKSFSSMPWCSGYHICLTRRRSPVRSSVASVFCICDGKSECNSSSTKHVFRTSTDMLYDDSEFEDVQIDAMV